VRRAPSTPQAGPRSGFARTATLLVLGGLLALVGETVYERLRTEEVDRQRREFDLAREHIERTFVQERDTGRLLVGALRGMTAELDPYSKFYDHTETARLERETTGLYDGIGVLFAPLEERWRILFPLPHSPAEAAGLRVGDRLLTVGGEDATQLELPALRALFADGSAGAVELEVEGLDGMRRTAAVQPAQVIDPSIRRIRLIEGGPAPVGYLSIGAFSRRTSADFDETVAQLRARGAAALVVDLRGNLGGVLTAALEIANRFVAEGTLLETVSRDGVEVTRADPRAAHLAGLPTVLLVDRSSASASEVLAGALQDHRVAVLVGEPTYGKGTVQSLTPLPRLQGVLRVTTAVYRTPAGRLIERSLEGAWDAGLAPDLAIDLDDGERRALAEYLSAFGPRLDCAEAVAAWERRDGLQLVAPHPPDPVLDAALQLLAGERPLALAAKGSGEQG
jgi:carboxyl-terminal processing protease